MKKIFTVVAALLLILSFSVWAGAQQEEEAAAPEMDKIVYLTSDYADNPEAHPLWKEEFERITGVELDWKSVSSKDAGEAMMARFIGCEHLDVVKYGEDDISPLARQEFIIPLDEFVDSLKKIRDNYPAPDGKPMFPYISKTYHHGYIAMLSNYFDVSLDPAIRRPTDTKFREGWDSPQFKDYAEFMKMLWDEELIDPDHALPQKASKTRSKLYAGKGAYLAMWTYRYPADIEWVREKFPGADIALVPPIKNPKGGALGLAVVPGYRPFCITSKAANPQFVWDTFIETVILSTEGAMLQNRGIPNVSYKIVDNTFQDNEEESGISMKTRPPLDPDIKFPYKLSPLMERGAEIEQQFDQWFSENNDYAVAEEPSRGVPAFDMIYDDMKDKKNQLFWKYVIGEHSFEEMMKQFEAYKKEVDFDSILAEINAGL